MLRGQANLGADLDLSTEVTRTYRVAGSLLSGALG